MNKNIKISVSILDADFAILGKEIKEIISYGIDNIHFDVMDNNYVPNMTFGPCVLKSLRKFGIKKEIDVHLMTNNLDDFILKFSKSGANSIFFHPETSNNYLRSIELINKNNCKSGIVINPTTSLNVLDYIFNEINTIVIMSVNPGFSNQKFIKNILYKIEKTKLLIEKNNNNINLAVDGGVNNKNIKSIIDAGANVIIIGSYIFKDKKYKENIESIMNNI